MALAFKVGLVLDAGVLDLQWILLALCLLFSASYFGLVTSCCWESKQSWAGSLFGTRCGPWGNAQGAKRQGVSLGQNRCSAAQQHNSFIILHVVVHVVIRNPASSLSVYASANAMPKQSGENRTETPPTSHSSSLNPGSGTQPITHSTTAPSTAIPAAP